MSEEWRVVEGYDGAYEVSSMGRVRTKPLQKKRKDGVSYFRKAHVFDPKPKQGYPAVQLPGGAVCIHTLAATAFIGPRPDTARTINHKDGDKKNNCVENLEWASYAENNRHARLMNLNKQHGEKCNLTKFSDNATDAVKILGASGRFTQLEIGGLLGMSETHVNEIIKGRSRRRLTA